MKFNDILHCTVYSGLCIVVGAWYNSRNGAVSPKIANFHNIMKMAVKKRITACASLKFMNMGRSDATSCTAGAIIDRMLKLAAVRTHRQDVRLCSIYGHLQVGSSSANYSSFFSAFLFPPPTRMFLGTCTVWLIVQLEGTTQNAINLRGNKNAVRATLTRSELFITARKKSEHFAES